MEKQDLKRTKEREERRGEEKNQVIRRFSKSEPERKRRERETKKMI